MTTVNFIFCLPWLTYVEQGLYRNMNREVSEEKSKNTILPSLNLSDLFVLHDVVDE